MVLVSISGTIGSGKSTLAELLTSIDSEHSLHIETSTIIVELGNSFNAALRARGSFNVKDSELANSLVQTLLPQLATMAGKSLSLEDVQIDEADLRAHPEWYEKLFIYVRQVKASPDLLDETITPANKNNYRALLQWIGGYFLYRLNNPLLWYEEVIRRAEKSGPNIELIAVTAPRQPLEAEFVKQKGGIVIKIVRPGLLADTTDVTERQVAAIVADTVVTNDADLEALQLTTQKIHQDLLAGGLRNTYITSRFAAS